MVKKAILVKETKQPKKTTYLRIVLFAAVFGIVKLSGFSAALLLSSICDLADYGRFEYALALGLLLSIPLNYGLQGAYPYFNVRLYRRGYRSIFYFHALLVGGIVLLLIGADTLFFHLISPQLSMAALLGAVIAMQVLLSSVLKSHEKIMQAVLLEGGCFLMINGFIAYLFWAETAFDFAKLQLLLLAYLLCLFGLYFYNWIRSRSDFLWKKYLLALKYGRNLVFSSFLLILLTASGRIFVEYFIDIQTVGYYSFYLRFATINIMIQQVFLIVFFRKIYQSAPQLLDRYFAPFLGGLLMISFCLWWSVPALLSDYLPLLKASVGEYRLLYFILGFHTVAWACLAFNENMIHRERLSSEMNKQLIGVFAMMLGALVVLNYIGLLTVERLALINFLALFAGAEIQFTLLARLRNFNLTRSRLLLRLASILFILGFIIL